MTTRVLRLYLCPNGDITTAAWAGAPPPRVRCVLCQKLCRELTDPVLLATAAVGGVKAVRQLLAVRRARIT